MNIKFNFWFFIKKYWVLIIFLTFIIWSQWIILKPHLKYGFSDVDWGFLTIYKTQNNYSPVQFIKNLKEAGTRGGVYTHQIYYIGILGDFFNLNYESYHRVTHFFKILTVVFSFPVFFMISGSLLIAALATFIFSFSAPAFGTLYTVVTSSDYSAVFAMEVFLIVYGYIIKKNISKLAWLIMAVVLLVLTLFLSTERMYPLPLVIIFIELFQLLTSKKQDVKLVIKRLFILLSPMFLIFIAKPSVFLNFFQGNGLVLIDRIGKGDWNLTLTPFIALGSMMIPIEYNKYFGVPNLKSLIDFISFFVNRPFIVFTLLTVFLKFIVFKKEAFFTRGVLALSFLFNLLLYVGASHFVNHQITSGAIVQASFGMYILSLSIVSFWFYLKNKNRLLVGLFIGPWVALFYIILTWLGASPAEVFSGVHRYLTVPSLTMALFFGSLVGLSFINIFKLPKYFSWLSLLPILAIMFFVVSNYQAVSVFFDNQLSFGFGAEDKNLMRGQLNSFLNNLSSEEPSLFYFDFSDDNIRGYYYDNSLLAGFQSWMQWHRSINFNPNILPNIFWNNIDLLKSSVTIRNGESVISYGGKIYHLDNFYAFKLKDKKVIDIKEQILSEIGI